MSKIIRFLQTADDRVNLGLGYLAAGASLVCMVLIFADIVSRNIFNSPISGTLEISTLLFAIMIFGSITYLETRHAHINITLLYSRYPPKVQTAFDIFAQILQTILFALFAVQTFIYFHFSWAMDEISWGSIALPLWIPKFVIFTGCLLFFLHSLGSLTLKLARVGGKR